MTDERPGEREGFKAGKVTDESDAEGHALRGRSHATEGTDEPPSDDTQGNAFRGRPFTPDAERPAQPGEQKGVRPKGISDESDTDG